MSSLSRTLARRIAREDPERKFIRGGPRTKPAKNRPRVRTEILTKPWRCSCGANTVNPGVKVLRFIGGQMCIACGPRKIEGLRNARGWR